MIELETEQTRDEQFQYALKTADTETLSAIYAEMSGELKRAQEEFDERLYKDRRLIRELCERIAGSF